MPGTKPGAGGVPPAHPNPPPIHSPGNTGGTLPGKHRRSSGTTPSGSGAMGGSSSSGDTHPRIHHESGPQPVIPSTVHDPRPSVTQPGTPPAGHTAPGAVGASPGDSGHALPRPRDPVSGPHPEIPPGEPMPSDSMVGAARVDPNAPTPPPHPRLATSPSLRTLPSVVPFRAPVRGDMIRNGSVGVYFMGEYIGGGSYGDVYECTDEWSNPLVAKVLKAAASFEEVKRQWESEVANLSRMRHPNITYIHDAFFYDNAFYIIVEKCLYSLDRVLPRIDESWLPTSRATCFRRWPSFIATATCTRTSTRATCSSASPAT